MNKTTASTIETELKALKNEVKYLRRILEKVVKEKEVTRDELMQNASRVFEVTSKETKDDKNIANPKNIKPVDFSSYA